MSVIKENVKEILDEDRQVTYHQIEETLCLQALTLRSI